LVDTNIQQIDFRSIVIVEVGGKGAFGQVKRGVWNSLEVAVKQLNDSEEGTQEFLKEVIIISTLNHKNVVGFIGICVKPTCLVIEFMARGSAWDILHNKKRTEKLPYSLKYKIALDTAEGMTYLHSCNIIHRDLKPQNLLIDLNWTVKIADFGLARTKIASTMTKVGTPRWVAPEVIRENRYSEKADVYSYGVILWEMDTEEIPYGEHTQALQVITQVAYHGVRLPVPPKSPFQSLMKDCLETKNPDARPSFPRVIESLKQIQEDPAFQQPLPIN